MVTWGDAIKRRDAAFIAASHFEGTEEEAKQRINRQFDDIGYGVMRDLSISEKELEQLSRDTPLGSQAEAMYTWFVEFVG